ncbi:hypothetical protein [Streptomyces hiroshimensis]|uniref:Allene oxide cyclase n=1 Tax=Streptomyces hiroshimensis TaxID=66424 RepID=A0ABQ2Y5K3_9ACTN|nr:hypothetical protein [Streptomyces hiroshimensis]GGX65310.1 hypothetical protein GCM10010324_07900 [Streptomyces hiroshimensis]
MRLMRRQAAVVAAAAAVAATAVAVALPSPQPAAADGEKTLAWTAVHRTGSPPEHPKEGDTWAVYADLQGPGGEPAGDGSAVCTVVLTRYEGVVAQCRYVLRGNDGTLVLESMENRFGRGPYRADAAVVGGTGAYAGAKGEVQLTIESQRTAYRVRLK